MEERFLNDHNSNYNRALTEMQAGLKTSHWIWFVFPQMAVNKNATEKAKKYEIQSLEEAIEYCQHPVLGKKLIEITKAVTEHLTQRDTLLKIFGNDGVKFISCMSLFAFAAKACGDNELFEVVSKALEKGNDGRLDTSDGNSIQSTASLLNRSETTVEELKIGANTLKK
jgi:uncharacterized protein (DUF1810 family)